MELSSQQHIPRLFIPLGGNVTVDGHGLPVWSDGFYTDVQQAEWEKWQDANCLVLLGEPGCGKSMEFAHQHHALLDKGLYSFLIPLGDYFGGCALGDLVDDKGRWSIWQNDRDAVAYLFLDSLDEGRLDFPEVLKAVAAQMRNLPCTRLKLRLSCRVRDWRSTDVSSLATLFPKKENSLGEPIRGVTELELLGFHWGAIQTKAERCVDNPEAFLDKVWELKIQNFCSHPLLLEFLLDQFKETSQLGRTKAEIYSSAIDRMLREENSRHGRAKKLTTPTARREAASKIAVLAMLSGHEHLYVPDIDQPADDKSLDVTLSGEEKDTLLEVLDTKLFLPGRRGEFRFYHRSMAEFLAAEFMVKRLRAGFPFLQIKPMLFGENGVPTPLRGTVGWLASSDARTRKQCFQADPLLIFEGDFSSFDIPAKEDAILILKRRFQDMDFQHQVRDYGELAVGCDQKLLAGLLAQDNSGAVRVMALDLIADGHVSELFGLVQKIAMDLAEEKWLRPHAAMIVAKQGNATQKAALKPLLYLPPDSDPNDEIAGVVLDGLFPSSLTVAEALDALHTARNPNLTGAYRRFWHSRFESRLKDEDLDVALPRIYALISQAGEGHWASYENSYITELFGKLLVRYLADTPQPDSQVIAPWLDLFKDFGALEYGYHENDIKGQITDWLKLRPEMKSALLRWALERNPSSEKQRFGTWNVPFPEVAWEISDFEWLCNEAKAETSQAIQYALFDVAWMLWAQNDYVPTGYFERMEDLAAICPQSGQMWGNGLVADIDSEAGLWRRKGKLRRETEERDREKTRQLVQNSTIAIAAADAKALEFLSGFMHDKKVEIFGRPDFSVLEEAFGGEARKAAEIGFAKAWDEAAIANLEALWRDSAIPWSVIVLGYALEAAWLARRINWEVVASSQVETAFLLGAKHHSDFPVWFEPFYRARREAVEALLERILVIETKEAEFHPTLCHKIEYSKILQNELIDFIHHYLFSHGAPVNNKALSALLTVAIRSPSEKLVRYLEQHTRRGFDGRRRQSDWQVGQAVLFLAAWWLLDWQPAWNFSIKKMLKGENWKETFLAFVGAVRALTHKISMSDSWPESIPIEANIELMPYLYRALPPAKDPRIEGAHSVSVRETLGRLRDSVISQISTGDPQIAKQAFMRWLKQPEFSQHKTWFRHMLRDLDQRMVDEEWQAPTAQQVSRVIFRDGRLVRNGGDLFTMLEDVLGLRMREKLLDDASLVPQLLWQGAKKSGRKPTDEKALQQLLANQLMLLLDGMGIVGAREPEVFDAKKPDFRVSAVLDNGASAEIPIEVKQAHADDVWSAPLSQLSAKYMKPSNTNYGIYLVGWYGGEVSHPEIKKKYVTHEQLETALGEYVNGGLAGTGKKIAVFVYDVRVDDARKK